MYEIRNLPYFCGKFSQFIYTVIHPDPLYTFFTFYKANHFNPSLGRMNSKILKRYLGNSIGKQQK